MKPAENISEAEQTITPLQALANRFDSDMEAVNALILKHLQSDVSLIPEIAAYLIKAGGKRIRPLLTLASARLHGDESDRPYQLAAAVEFIHTATLLHDDVVDDSDERRGQKSAPVVFGNQSSVLVGDFLFSRAFQLMVADGSLDTLRVLSNASAVIAEGEVMQLMTTNNIDTTLEQYKKVIGAKTAALFAAACEIGPIMAKAGKDAEKAMATYGYNLGMAFQIADDVLDYTATSDTLGKAVGDDLKEGKMTAPVIMAVAESNNEERAFWKNLLGKPDIKDDIAGQALPRAMAIMTKYDTLNKSLLLATQYAEKATETLSYLPDSPLKTDLAVLAQFVITRQT